MSLTYTQVNKVIANRQRQRDTNHQVKKTTGDDNFQWSLHWLPSV